MTKIDGGDSQGEREREIRGKIDAAKGDVSAKRKDSLRRIEFARTFLDSVVEQHLGQRGVFGTSEIRIHWQDGEVKEIDIAPGRIYR